METTPTSPTNALPSPRGPQFPTTFVQADTTSFKQVVQMLTGTDETASAAAKTHPTSPNPTGLKKPAFKLYERRNSLVKNNHLNVISPNTHPYHQHQRTAEILSPSTLDSPSLALSPVTPLVPDPFQKGFYLIPSPRSALEPPKLLPLFPLSSPRSAENASSSTLL